MTWFTNALTSYFIAMANAYWDDTSVTWDSTTSSWDAADPDWQNPNNTSWYSES